MINQGLAKIIEQKARRREKALLFGTVTKVFEKTSNDISEGNIEVNIQTQAVDHELRRVPVVAASHTGHAAVPSVDDTVIISFLHGRGREPVVIGTSPNNEIRSPHARSGHWRHEWENNGEKLYLEATPSDHSAGTPDTVRFAIKPDGLSEPTTAVGIDNSGDTPQITLETDGNVGVASTDGSVSVDAANAVDVSTTNGSVSINVTGGDATVNATDGNVTVSAPNGSVTLDADTVSIDGSSVSINGTAFESHTHNFTDADGGSGTTDGVN